MKSLFYPQFQSITNNINIQYSNCINNYYPSFQLLIFPTKQLERLQKSFPSFTFSIILTLSILPTPHPPYQTYPKAKPISPLAPTNLSLTIDQPSSIRPPTNLAQWPPQNLNERKTQAYYEIPVIWPRIAPLIPKLPSRHAVVLQPITQNQC